MLAAQIYHTLALTLLVFILTGYYGLPLQPCVWTHRRSTLRPDLCSHDVLVMITCVVFCVTRVDDSSQDFSLFKAKQRENPEKDVFLIQGFCLEKPNSSRGLWGSFSHVSWGRKETACPSANIER